VIDTVTRDHVLEAGFSEAARDRARGIVQTFEAFIAEHRDEITALQILYNRPTKAPLTFDDLKALADSLHAPPHLIDESLLWQAYAALDRSRVKGTSRSRILTDLVSLVRFAMQQDNELVPYPERVASNFKAWLAQRTPAALHPRTTTLAADDPRPHRRQPRHHLDDFEYAPFNKEGGLGRVHQLFGEELPKVIEALNRELVA
jgi:type I restriction enzyme R subunit